MEFEILKNIVTMVVTKSGETFKVLFDVEHIPKVSKRKWYINDSGYCYTTINGKRKGMACYLLGIKSKTFVADHIDGDRLNNLNSNLRTVTRRQNSKNVTKTWDRFNNTSGFKGVSYHIGQRKYTSKIGVDNKQIWVGTFDSAFAAAKAYDEAARAYHGEFAYLNFPRRDIK